MKLNIYRAAPDFALQLGKILSDFLIEGKKKGNKSVWMKVGDEYHKLRGGGTGDNMYCRWVSELDGYFSVWFAWAVE